MAKDLPQLKEYLDNKNVQWFIYNILKNESDKTSDGKINTGGYNQNAGNSSAFGAGQFIGSTRNNILKEYNVDAWSPDLEEQKLAIVALLDNVGQLDEIKKGDFSSQYDSKKGQWEAFHNKEGILDNKPKKWETEYTTLSDTAVYRPDESWAKIPEDVKVEKLDLFEKKYNGLPTEIVNPIDNVLDPTAEALGLPTSEELQSKLVQYESLKAYDDLVAKGERDPYIINPNYDVNRPQSEQFLENNSDLAAYFQGEPTASDAPTTEPSGQNRSAGYEGMTEQDLQSIYQMLLESDAAAKAAGEQPALVSGEFESGPQAPQFLEKRIKRITPSSQDISSSDQNGADLSTPSTTSETTGRASGYEGMSAQDLQNIYQGLLEADAAAAAAGVPPALVSGEFEEGPQAPQFLARRMQGVTSANPADANFVGPPEMSLSDPLNPNFVGPPEAPDEPIEPKKPLDPVDRNFLSKLKGQDYTGLLSDIGSYAARMGPLMRAMREADSYDQVRYPRFSPALPTAYAQKSDIDTAFNTARRAAMQQGKLDLGALSALATQQARSVAGVEENVANERIGLLNQAQQLNNQITMQEMADTAANKGAAATMKYQALAAMSEMGQGSLREANMRRNDAIVKEMFSNVFGDEFGNYLKDKYSNA